MPHDTPHLPFFVYGSLRRGHLYHGLISDAVRATRPAVLPDAVMYDAGDYPYAILGGGGLVHGELVEVGEEDYPAALKALDRLEEYAGPGHPANDYDRLALTVLPEGDRPVPAWVYITSPAREERVRAMPLVPGGDWASHVTTRS